MGVAGGVRCVRSDPHADPVRPRRRSGHADGRACAEHHRALRTRAQAPRGACALVGWAGSRASASATGGRRSDMYDPILFRDRPRPVQVLLGGIVPALAGAVAGVLVGVSSGAYWGYSLLTAIGAIVGGF